MFYHHSNDPDFKLDDREYILGENFKPNGLWIAKGDEWRDWTNSEQFMKCTYRYKVDVDLDRVLIIKTLDDLANLVETYMCEFYIDWEKVSKDYSGIYFDNYSEIKEELWSSNMWSECSWYLAVDVSSLCVWDLSIVKLGDRENVSL